MTSLSPGSRNDKIEVSGTCGALRQGATGVIAFDLSCLGRIEYY